MGALFLDYLNSAWSLEHGSFSELLEDEKWIIDLLTRWECNVSPHHILGQTEFLRQFRIFCDEITVLLEMGQQITPDLQKKINHILSAVPLVSQLDWDGSNMRRTIVPAIDSIDSFYYLVLADLLDFYLNHPASALKHCQNPSCRWLFVDESKNGSRKWCCNTCASLMKVRRFRKAHARPEK